MESRTEPVTRSQALGKIIVTGQQVFRLVTRLVRRYELTESQYNALRILRGAERREERLTQAELAERLIASRANTTWILDKLEERKLVQRKEHNDRRKNIVEITAAGQKLLARIDPEWEAMLDTFMGEVSSEDLRQLAAILNKFRFN
ncbi:MAG: MarR family transcriptional regulator [Planctomycetaceae bacterium]|nr:hypothetical protein [Planctomycetota bacterium]MCQ3950427.1 hypothetical protein [Planctomycetota bacterium]NUO15948.1 MarR family transcriptional regulator [Planctomycetaceae bacterium]GIK53325.1 MAG: MarR family transcriptional regulator [Planctomycetota bacterium]HRJ79982.1 MarR family transcriptional regulator [Planctomycetota bacterium]